MIHWYLNLFIECCIIAVRDAWEGIKRSLGEVAGDSGDTAITCVCEGVEYEFMIPGDKLAVAYIEREQWKAIWSTMRMRRWTMCTETMWPENLAQMKGL